MDFTPTETQREIAGLAARALRDARPVDVSVPAVFDRGLWKELARAGLLSLPLPGWLDGDGLGIADVAALLTEAGRSGAAVPAFPTLALGVLPAVRWADRALQEDLLTGVGTGDAVLTAALREPSDPRPARPATVATLSDPGDAASGDTVPGGTVPGDTVPGGTASGGTVSGGTVSGVKIGVPYCAEARRVLVPASTPDGGTAVVVIDPADAVVTPAHTSGGEPEYTLHLERVPVRGVLADGALEGLYQLALAGALAVADGAVAAALALTTRHIGTREQFGRPLATFQAAAQHAADVYIAARTLHLAVTSACWRLDEGLDARADLDVAAYWLASRAPAAMRACHHLHGGMGMDVTYPLPRLSGMVKDLVRFTGGADWCLEELADGSGRVH